MKNFFNPKRTILIAILVLAVFLRFWNLSGVPPTASMDEASIGYNAYSLSKIGVDEYGKFPILSHRAYDDWRRATYLYFVTPAVAIFGLNAVSVRLPAAILSVLTVLATYFLVKELFPRSKQFSIFNFQFSIPEVTAFLLAISPWHIYISRLGHESNACLSFLVFGVLFFLQGEKKKNWILILISLVFFTLSMISYYSGQALIPLFVLGLFFIFRKNLLSMVSSDKKILVVFFIFLVLLFPLFKGVFSTEALVRFQGTSTFKPEEHQEEFDKQVEFRNNAVKNNDIIGTIIYNRRLFPIRVFMEGYLSHFRPQWLFTNSGGEPHKVPNMGLLYLWEIPFIVIGLVVLLSSRVFDMKVKKLLFLWFFLAPLPAALATQAPHAMRSYNFLPTWQIFTALGLTYVFFKSQKFKILILFTFAPLILASLLTFYRNYFLIFSNEQSASFQYAFSRAIPYVLSKQRNYDKIVFSNKDNLYQSYMLFLFYSKYDPTLYQKQGGTISGGFAETHRFDKFEFRKIEWEKELKSKEILYIGNVSDFPQNLAPLFLGYFLDGKAGVKVVQGQQ